MDLLVVLYTPTSALVSLLTLLAEPGTMAPIGPERTTRDQQVPASCRKMIACLSLPAQLR
jgi:hypothetical protein